jgi:hypothetical protein
MEIADKVQRISKGGARSKNPKAYVRKQGLDKIIEAYLAQPERFPDEMHNAILDVARRDFGMNV